jgi:hypothetical protein
MPVYHRPARVVIDEGGSPLAAIAAVIALAVIISAASAIITDVLTAILIALAAVVLGSLGVLAIVLRRGGVAITQPPPAPARAPVPARPARAARSISAPLTLAIEAPAAPPHAVVHPAEDHAS